MGVREGMWESAWGEEKKMLLGNIQHKIKLSNELHASIFA